MSSLFGASIAALEGAMRFRAARQAVISGNVANANTPGYRRFELSLQDQTANRLTQSDPRHLASNGTSDPRFELERGDYGTRPDRNGVDLDHELIELSRNAGAFEEQAELLTRLLSLRRIAVTGESR